MKNGVEANIKNRELDIREKELKQKTDYDNQKLEIDKMSAKGKAKAAKV